MEVDERVTRLLEPHLDTLGVRLYDVGFGGGVLSVFIEALSDDEPFDLDTIAAVTRHLSGVLDDADPLPGHYTLEVSSPGLERRLRRPDHFVGAVGLEVTLRTTEAVDGQRRFDGVLSFADDEGIVVEGRRFPYHAIDKARTVFRWGPAPKPGKAGAAGSSGRSR